MTQGIVSIRKDGVMVFKVVVGCDGYNAKNLANSIREVGSVPSLTYLFHLCEGSDFGCKDCRVIIESDETTYSTPVVHGENSELAQDKEGMNRYVDTFRVAQFNPRWKYGTADYVEVVDF